MVRTTIQATSAGNSRNKHTSHQRQCNQRDQPSCDSENFTKCGLTIYDCLDILTTRQYRPTNKQLNHQSLVTYARPCRLYSCMSRVFYWNRTMSIRETINDYRKNHRGDLREPSQFALRCFVGMLETGEAVAEDFDAARSGLSVLVINFQRQLNS